MGFYGIANEMAVKIVYDVKRTVTALSKTGNRMRNQVRWNRNRYFGGTWDGQGTYNKTWVGSGHVWADLDDYRVYKGDTNL